MSQKKNFHKVCSPYLLCIIFFLTNFEPKKFRRFFRFLPDFRPNFFDSKSAEMKVLLWKVDMGNKLYEIKFFELCSKKLELMKQNHLLKMGFVIFLRGATFSDFVDYRLWNYMPSGIQICIPLFWGKFFQLGSRLIKQWGGLIARVRYMGAIWIT